MDKAEAGLSVSMAVDKIYGDGGFKLDVIRDSDGNLTYESSDTSVLVVDEHGGVEIVGAGYASVTEAALYGIENRLLSTTAAIRRLLWWMNTALLILSAQETQSLR